MYLYDVLGPTKMGQMKPKKEIEIGAKRQRNMNTEPENARKRVITAKI